MKNSKKIVAIALALVMLVGGVIAGTMAWFTDDEAATNVIEVGDVVIDLDEKNADGDTDEDYRDWLANQWLLPGTGTGENGNQLDKIVTVKNVGTNDAYIRVQIYVPANIADVIHFNQSNTDWTAINTPAAKTAAKWDNANVTIGGVEYVNYTLYYLKDTNGTLRGTTNATVDATVQEAAVTSSAIDSIYLDKYVDCDTVDDKIEYYYGYNAEDEKVHLSELTDGKANIIVVAEAIQAAGFTTEAAAWANFEDQIAAGYEVEYAPYYTVETIAP